MPITFAQATLGDKIQVPTLDGKVEYEELLQWIINHQK